jgi:hypothetical protein
MLYEQLIFLEHQTEFIKSAAFLCDIYLDYKKIKHYGLYISNWYTEFN